MKKIRATVRCYKLIGEDEFMYDENEKTVLDLEVVAADNVYDALNAEYLDEKETEWAWKRFEKCLDSIASLRGLYVDGLEGIEDY